MRAWDPKRKKFDTHIGDGNIRFSLFDISKHGYYLDNHRYFIIQKCINETDHSRTPIFVGDILSQDNITIVIEFDSNLLAYVAHHKNSHRIELLSNFYLNRMNIIGHIFEYHTHNNLS